VRVVVNAILIASVSYFLLLATPALATPIKSAYSLLLDIRGGGWIGYRLAFIGTILLLAGQVYSFKLSQRHSKKLLDMHCYLTIAGGVLILIHSGFPFAFRYANPFTSIYAGMGIQGLVGAQGIAAWLVFILVISGAFGKYIYGKISPGWRRIFKNWLLLHIALTGALYVTGMIHLFLVLVVKHISAI